MQLNEIKIGSEVVRSIGDYVVGRIGIVTDINSEKQRAQVSWAGNTKTWVSLSVIEPTSIPYEIIRIPRKHGKYRRT